MNKNKILGLSWLHNELIAGRTWFDWCFLLLGLCCQVAAYVTHPTTPIHLVAGIAGILSVYLCANGKISMFIFSVVNIVTYGIIALNQRLYGEVAINGFYFACQAWGIYTWATHYKHADEKQSGHLVARTLSRTVWYSLIAATLIGSLITGYYLDNYTNDSDPYFDAFTTVPAFAAEIMMVSGISQHWFLWFFIDLGCIWMWLRAGDISMAVLKGFWCANCLYGLYKWSKTERR